MASQEYLTLREYRIRLGWSINKLAIEAGVVRQAAANAEAGQPIRAETAKALADALSRGYGREIDVLDIKGLNILWDEIKPAVEVTAGFSLKETFFGYPPPTGCATRCPLANEQHGEESYIHQPQPLVRFYCYDAHPRYDEDSKTRNSETSPPCRPADTDNEEQTDCRDSTRFEGTERMSSDYEPIIRKVAEVRPALRVLKVDGIEGNSSTEWEVAEVRPALRVLKAYAWFK